MKPELQNLIAAYQKAANGVMHTVLEGKPRHLLALVVLWPWQCLAATDQMPVGDTHQLVAAFADEKDPQKKELLLMDISSHPETAEDLLQLTESTGDEMTEYLGFRGLGQLQYKPAEVFLRQALDDKRPNIRANAARALGELHDKVAVAPIIKLLSTEDNGGVVEQSVLALTMLQAHEAVPGLRRLLDRDFLPKPAQTRCWIIQAIGVLGSARDVALLAGHLSGTDGTGLAAAEAIERITGRDFGLPRGSGPTNPAPGIERAQKWWNDHKQDRTYATR